MSLMQTATPPGRSASPARDQIYERIRDAIVEGQMQFGDRLPPVRSLAADFGLARGTVLAALHRLAGEGYIQASGSAGTHVVFRRPGDAQNLSPWKGLTVPPRIDTSAAPALRPGVPAFDAFPKKLWSRLVGAEARRINAPSMECPNSDGDAGLKRAIASYLQVSRGVACEPDQVFITSCYQGSQQFIRQLILNEGDPVWVEDPGYAPVLRYLRASGMRVVPVPVDSDGACVERGVEASVDARAAYLSPTHQFPLGFRLSDERRSGVLDWACAASAWIIEDDYDGEFHYSERTTPALKSVDRHDRVIFCGTFSKVLFPSIRIGYMVMPRALVEEATMLARLLRPAPAPLMQKVVAEFIRDGHFSRHLARMRRLYKHRRQLLLSAMTDYFPATWCVDNASSGMHLLLRLPVSDHRVADQAGRLGLGVLPLSRMFVASTPVQGLVMGFADVTSESHADDLAKRLRHAVDIVTNAS